MGWAVWIIGIAAALFALDRLGLWAERRGWLYYRKTRKRPGAMGDVFLHGAAFLDPTARHMAEAREERAMEEDDNGEGDDDDDAPDWETVDRP